MVPTAFSELMMQFERLVQTNCCGLFAGLPADHWSWVSGEPPGETQQHHPSPSWRVNSKQLRGGSRHWMFLFLTTKAWWWWEADAKLLGMMGTKPHRPDLCASLEPKLQVVEIPVSPQGGRQTLIWPTDLLSHIYIHDTFQMNRDKAPFYITQSGQIPTITSMWSNSKSQSILALPRTPWTPPTSYLHPDLTKEKDGVRVCSLRICPGSQGRHGIHSQSHLVSFTPLRAEW